MPTVGSAPLTRALGVLVAGVGLGTFVTAPRAAAAAAGNLGPTPDPRIVRVLGARQVVQGAVTFGRPEASTVGVGAAADIAHALSMIALGFAVPRYRRPALISALLAGATAALGGLTLLGERPTVAPGWRKLDD